MKKLTLLTAAYLLPVAAFAQNASNNGNNGGALELLNSLIDTAVPIVFALAILFFLFQLATFLFGTGEKKEEARSGMIYGIIILLVMFSIAGILSLLQNTFDIGGSNNNIDVPTINVGGGGIQR